MKVLSLIFLFTVLLLQTGLGNNVRIEGDVRVLDSDVVGDVATVKIRVKWDNSWRDAFNYDAVYLFLKFKVDGSKGSEEVWHHAYLKDTGHKISTGYSYLMSNSGTTADKNQGMFIFPSGKTMGDASVDLELKWNIKSNPDRQLDRNMFTTGSVFLSAMGVEMVYVPRGAFRVGDTRSDSTFLNRDMRFPAKYDLLSPDSTTWQKCRSSDPASELGTTPNRAEFALNRMDDVAPDNSNAWVGVTSVVGTDEYCDYWEISFKQLHKIRSLAIESIVGGTPKTWEFQGQNVNTGQWTSLYSGDGTQWAVGSRCTYPCTRTITIPDYTTSYMVYRIAIKSTDNRPVIKNIAMSDSVITNTLDNSVLIYDQTTKMDSRFGLYANDKDTWSGNLQANYPNGYGAFFAMKYEISQEQYVSFLNKLAAAQQRVRTIGSDLQSIKEGQYVFGPDRNAPSYRNGIKLASIGVNDAPYVFANDLNPGNEYAQNGDGQNIACNYLNAGDMLAYADWCGLRPLSELEYEKMARRPFPEPALRGEYAWNTNGNFSMATSFVGGTAGMNNERLESGNVNAGAKLGGPVRTGAFAANSPGQVGAGASFWGVMDLSGNLAELYYNVNTEGRVFSGAQNTAHGDGKIGTDGKSNVAATLWPEAPNAFALRGGSFIDQSGRARISDRNRHWEVYANVNEVNAVRLYTATFRLGRTAPVGREVSEVVMENGQTSASASAVDSICSGSDYSIKGSIPPSVTGAYRVAWFTSSDNGVNWNLIDGEEAPALSLKNLRNINSKEDVFKDYLYKRYIYTNEADIIQTNPVKIRVINHTINLNSSRDTVDIYDHSNGIRIEVPQTSEFSWTWIRQNDTRPMKVEYIPKPGKVQLHYFRYKYFMDGGMFTGDQRILLNVKVMNKCWMSDTIKVYVKPMPTLCPNVNADGTVNTAFRCGDIMQDNEEGLAKPREYRTVEIGGKCWMADNLNRGLKSGQQGSTKCYGDKAVNCDTLGRLYNWLAATQNNATAGIQGICPKGWHLPTNAEWEKMLTATGGTKNTADNGEQLKSSLNYWNWVNEARVGNNFERFSALPTGGYFYRYGGSAVEYNTHAGIKITNGYMHQRNYAFWWTSTNASHYWITISYGNSYNVLTMPYYVRYDNATNMMVTYESTTNGTWTYGYPNSVFSSGEGNYLAYSYNTSGLDTGYNLEALNNIRGQFYFAVRCLRD